MEAAEQSLSWEREEEEEKDVSFTEGIVQRIRCVKLWVTHMGVVGKGGGVRRRLRGRVRGRSSTGACWPFGQVARWARAGFAQWWAGRTRWPRAQIGTGLHSVVGQPGKSFPIFNVFSNCIQMIKLHKYKRVLPRFQKFPNFARGR
jgi:hypothetical protein